MASYIYTYSDGDFRPDNISMFGYVFSREAATPVDNETAEKLDRHPHFRRVMGNGDNDAGLANTNATPKVSDEVASSKELSAKEKKAAYMREYMMRKRAGA
jgi:hypothetical protein